MTSYADTVREAYISIPQEKLILRVNKMYDVFEKIVGGHWGRTCCGNLEKILKERQ